MAAGKICFYISYQNLLGHVSLQCEPFPSIQETNIFNYIQAPIKNFVYVNLLM